MIETKERILDTAERLFAEQGHAATSLRSIIAEAGVNLAAVHYHFRNKEALLDAVLRRRLEPVNRERLAMLDEVERAAGAGRPSLEGILTALIGPPMRLIGDPALLWFPKLMGRILLDSDTKRIHEQFGETIVRFTAALARALPELPREELQWRAHFAVGVMAHTLLGTRTVLNIPGEPTVDRLVTFISAGFRAPVTAQLRSAR